MQNLQHILNNIKAPSTEHAKAAEVYLDGLTKPVGSLGKLEEIYYRLCSIQSSQKLKLDKKVVIIMCSDNGVCDEGISECPQEVTATVTYNFTRGITGINRMSHFCHSDIYIVDIGVKGKLEHPLIAQKKVRESTGNMTKEVAMTRSEVIQAIEVGIEAVKEHVEKGYEIFGTGEMGIGNTTTSSAVLSVLLDQEIEEVVGKGAGAKEETFKRKVEAIKSAIHLHNPNKEDVIDVLSKVGGLDLAGLCGVYLGASYYQKPVVIDGFIAAVAALCAYRLNPLVGEYLFPSHLSEEKGMHLVMDELKLKPYFELGMRLGEGTGCPITFQLMDMAHSVLTTMGTFEEANIEKEDYMDVWK
ncbi:nicotinate-nucleotide--dimethylbenzimidazole phosphoribosyltransferase [Sporanaerobium hydrogeniformans]|uniref:Nicotinate-nucleotide--dimethylbenzimidazole phosphoribosyltransferase n=1 Tax=Sporanaerobium hydrogeniformans TaxID=3072179 RepID=A0AC61DFM6_9FIRM|nr:nicotinate-nucleotide--dimethylbenzimidazole phosphoribosyltransferase [Sporanaerobium hydrogeniformans]PHV71725.1 nicotinate-nucleotide--dimethylbenzimidazole phosphoribosyltransferase [Sporanaerobium hydrogeniformans]